MLSRSQNRRKERSCAVRSAIARNETAKTASVSSGRCRSLVTAKGTNCCVAIGWSSPIVSRPKDSTTASSLPGLATLASKQCTHHYNGAKKRTEAEWGAPQFGLASAVSNDFGELAPARQKNR